MFYVIYINRLTDNTETREVTAYNDGASARGACYSKMGAAMQNPNVVRAFAQAVDEDGVRIVDTINYRTEVQEVVE